MLPQVSPAAQAANDARKSREDSLRTAYTSTFVSASDAASWAAGNGFDSDVMKRILPASRGNHAVLKEFLISLPDSLRGQGVALLEAISEKDLRDVPSGILLDFVHALVQDHPLFAGYVLNPRIANEGLTPWRGYFTRVFGDPARRDFFRENPEELVALVAGRVKIDGSRNPQSLRMSPESVWEYGIADKTSRDILFVALARTMGIPARIDPVSGNTQYAVMNGGESSRWVNVVFGKTDDAADIAAEGSLALTFVPRRHMESPGYYTHFTLSEITGGVPRLMEYPENATWTDTFAQPQPTAAGQYMLTSGQRMADGSVLARSCIFNVAPGDTAVVPLVVRTDTTGIEVIGTFDSESLYHDVATDTRRSLLSTSGRGYYALLLAAPGEEPTTHALRDLSACAERLQRWDRPIFLLSADGKNAAAQSALMSAEAPLPSTVVFGGDEGGTIARALDADTYPVLIVADTFNRVVFRSDGYSIGLGDRLSDIVSKLD